MSGSGMPNLGREAGRGGVSRSSGACVMSSTRATGKPGLGPQRGTADAVRAADDRVGGHGRDRGDLQVHHRHGGKLAHGLPHRPGSSRWKSRVHRVSTVPTASAGRDGHHDVRADGWWKQDLSGVVLRGRRCQLARGGVTPSRIALSSRPPSPPTRTKRHLLRQHRSVSRRRKYRWWRN